MQTDILVEATMTRASGGVLSVPIQNASRKGMVAAEASATERVPMFSSPCLQGQGYPNWTSDEYFVLANKCVTMAVNLKAIRQEFQ